MNGGRGREIRAPRPPQFMPLPDPCAFVQSVPSVVSRRGLTTKPVTYGAIWCSALTTPPRVLA